MEGQQELTDPPRPPVVTLLTDFGQDDGYVAAMKGTILSLAPHATVVDISHGIPPQDVHGAAFTLAQVHPFFPAGTVHLVVVDPGVGTERRPLLAAAGGAWFVAPDNGVLSYVLNAAPDPAPAITPPEPRLRPLLPPHAAWVLDRPAWHRPQVSHTFHGRDIFAPVAARLVAGVVPEQMGRPTGEVTVLNIPEPRRRGDGAIAGCIVHVDRFGNLITNIAAAGIPAGAVVTAGRTWVRGISRTYAEGGDIVALGGSSGRLEIAVRNGNAAQQLGLQRWDPVLVTPP